MAFHMIDCTIPTHMFHICEVAMKSHSSAHRFRGQEVFTGKCVHVPCLGMCWLNDVGDVPNNRFTIH